MSFPPHRIHFFEIADQEWYPKEWMVPFQGLLKSCWTLYIPGLSSNTAAVYSCSVLLETLGNKIQEYTFVDFCAGAGGPIPYMEKYFNGAGNQNKGHPRINFVMADLCPPVDVWAGLARGRPGLTYIPTPTDATNAPASLSSKPGRKVFRLWNLSFHHFDDEVASSMLANTLESADGFAICELQDRNLISIVALLGASIALFIITPFVYWRSPRNLIWVNLIPISLLTFFLDGVVSCMRTRTPEELHALLANCGASLDGWEFRYERKRFIWPASYLHGLIGVKKS